MPKLSVAIVAYNTEAYIKEAIDSILSQTYTDFELIIVDDGSTDATADIITAYSDKRLRFFRLPENRGRAVARNIALDAAQGEYLAWLDSDDTCTTDRLARQVNFLDNHKDISIVCAAMRLFEGARGIVHFPLYHDDICARQLFGVALTTGISCWRLPTIRAHGLRFNEAWNRGEDMIFFADMLFTSPLRAASMPDVLLNYRIGPRPNDLYWHTQALRHILNILDIKYSEKELFIHSHLHGLLQKIVDEVGVKDVLCWMDSLLVQCRHIHRFPTHALIPVFQNIAGKVISYSPNIYSALSLYRNLILSSGHSFIILWKSILTHRTKYKIKKILLK